MFIYADNAATTAMSERSIAAMLPWMREGYGNPSSLYEFGQRSAEAIASARAAVAKVLHCTENEVIFTGGGSEADNQALLTGAQWGARKGKRHIISTAFEHHAVLHRLSALKKEGFEVTLLPVHEDGLVRVEEVAAAIREDTALVSVMMVNNELGTVLPVQEIARGLKAKNPKTLLHTDAVQGFLKVPFSAKTLGADFITVSGHKLGAPKGVGALYIGSRVRNPKPLLAGGGQEQGLRSGTEATAQIAAFAKAVELRKKTMTSAVRHMEAVRAYAVEKLTTIEDLVLIGAGTAPHILSVSLAGWPSQNIVNDLGSQGICISAGSACHQGKPSHVVATLGLDKRTAGGVIRLSFGPETTFEEIDACAAALKNHHDNRMPMLK